MCVAGTVHPALSGARTWTEQRIEEPGTMAPFPWVPMLALSVSFLSNSYCISSLFAYLGYMMEHIGVADNKDEAGESLSDQRRI